MSLAPAEYNVASYLVVGILVVIFNLPLCSIILSDPQMRIIFGVLGALFTAGFLTGVGSILKALSRIFEYDSDLMDEYIFSGFRCLYKPYVLMDLFTFPSFSVLLMLNSFDRLVVISMPITYFKKSKTIVICEILFGLILISVLETYTIAMAVVDDDHDASIFCRQLDFLPVYVYKVNITFRLLCSVLAILLMLIVVYKLRQRSSNSKKLQQNPYEQAETSGLQAYMSKQNDFTKAMLISCAFTFRKFYLTGTSTFILFSLPRYH
ncbi:unnamed protein product [Anisakis simplex]|uniref:G_PROTEIN_RECEP_F1_2 domain-containing protein n=1 Tax=Anisakis simplex TaxID=6269 RepID=A0A0M3JRP1_ANISI|nr:unnamed protein product [Anisakis simplex]